MYIPQNFARILILCFVFLILPTEAYSQSKEQTPEPQETIKTREYMRGSWYSPEWEYGFAISDYTATITEWNNTYNPQDKNGRGDVVLKNVSYSETGFTASHLFYDGSWIDVTAVMVDENTIRLSGRREVWEMTRKN